MTSKTFLFISSLAVAVVHGGLAQTATLDADAAWNSVKNAGGSATPGSTTALIDAADQLRSFYTTYPNSAQARNAKALEGLALTQASLAGDDSQSQRRELVVAAARQDKAVDAPLRAELFALADSATVAKTPGLSRDNQLLAYEQSTRSLIAEFPGLSNGYESLLHLAHDNPETRAAQLAREVSGLAAAPTWVRSEAQVIVNRFALVGRSLVQAAGGNAAADDAFVKAAGRPVLIYSWSKSSGSSLLRAKAAAASATGATLIGVCLDAGDVEASSAQAIAAGLPGAQLFDAAGARGTVAGNLVLTEPGLIYRVDGAGLIQSVSVQNEAPASSATGLDVVTSAAAPLRMDPTKPAYPGILTSADPNQPPPFVGGSGNVSKAGDAVVPNADVSAALRAKIDAAFAAWSATKGVAEFKPSLVYAGVRAFLAINTVAGESAVIQALRLKAIVAAGGFLLAEDAFESVSLTVSFVDSAQPGIVPGRNVEISRAAFQAAVERAGAAADFATALAAVARDDRALAQIGAELGVP